MKPYPPTDFVPCVIRCHATGSVLGKLALPPALFREYESCGRLGVPWSAGLLLEGWILHHHRIAPDHVVRLERESEDPGPLTTAAVKAMRAELDAVPDGWTEEVTTLPLPQWLAAAVKRAAS